MASVFGLRDRSRRRLSRLGVASFGAARFGAARFGMASFGAACASAALLLALALAPAALAVPAGSVFATGWNGKGQLGTGVSETKVDKFEPVSKLPASVVSISSSDFQSLAALSNGSAYAWGQNTYGEIGDGTTAERRTPVQVAGVGGSGHLEGVTEVAAGEQFSLALLANGTVAAWGRDEVGQLGDGKPASQQTSPVLVKGVGGTGTLEHVVAIAAGQESAAALLSNGTVVTWGSGSESELGNGKTEEESTPVQVSGLEGAGVLEHVSAISAGAEFDLALLEDGEVLGWGNGTDGNLGDGSGGESDVPVEVQREGGGGPLTGVSAISAGADFALALLRSGEVVGWGSNYMGELGFKYKGELQETPVKIEGLEGKGNLSEVIAISAQSAQTLVVLADHRVAGWGPNQSGSLGSETFTEVDSPTLIPGLSGVFALSHGGEGNTTAVTTFAIEGAFATESLSSIDFGEELAGAASSTKTITVSNAGPAPLTISSDALTGSTEIAETADTCKAVTLDVGGKCAVTLRFSPSASGAANASLSFTSSAASGLSPIAVSGIGLPPLVVPVTTSASAKEAPAANEAPKANKPPTARKHVKPLIVITGRRISLAKGIVKASLRCKRSACRGVAKLLLARRVEVKREGKQTAVRKLVLIGRVRYSIRKGGKRLVVIRLRRRARRLLTRLSRGRRGIVGKLKVSVRHGRTIVRRVRL